MRKMQLHHNIDELREIDDDTVDDDVSPARSGHHRDLKVCRCNNCEFVFYAVPRMRRSGRVACDRVWSTWRRWQSCFPVMPSAS